MRKKGALFRAYTSECEHIVLHCFTLWLVFVCLCVQALCLVETFSHQNMKSFPDVVK